MIHISATSVQNWTPESYFAGNRNPCVDKRVTYYGNFRHGQDVWISTREGLVCKIQNSYSPSFPSGLIVLVNWGFNSDTRRSTQSFLQTDLAAKSVEAGHILKSLENPSYELLQALQFNNRSQHGLFYLVSEKQIVNHGGSVYVDRLDVTVSFTQPTQENHMHPYSVAGMSAREGLRIIESASKVANRDYTESDFIYALSIVDNADTIGPRYISSPTGVIKITPRKDPSLESGFYLAFRNEAEGPHTKPGLEVIISKDGKDIPWFTLHETPEQAILHRHEDSANALRIKIKEFEIKQTDIESRYKESQNKLQQAELANEKLARELQALMQSTKLEQQRHENEMEEMLRQIEVHRQKSILEMESMRRKNTSEIIKAFPSLLVGVIGLISLIVKLKKA